MKAIQWRTLAFGEGVPTNIAFVTCFFPAVDADVALTRLSPCRTGHYRAKYCLRIHLALFLNRSQCEIYIVLLSARLTSGQEQLIS